MMMMSHLSGDGNKLFGEVGAEPFLYSICNVNPRASNGQLKLHGLQNKRERLGPEVLKIHLLLTEIHYLF